MARSILIVATNVNQYEKRGYRTGLWLSELTHFDDVVQEAGFVTDIASPRGGFVPIDPESLLMTNMGEMIGIKGAVADHYRDRAYMDRLNDTRAIADVDVVAYDAIYLTGGHGVMFDFRDPALARLVALFHNSGKVVAAVCHGPCGLVDVVRADGRPLLEGKDVTGFSWAEEELVKRDDAVPYNLEETMKQRGGQYSSATLPFTAHVRTDGHLITGQNPTSAKGVAEAVVELLG